jgi:DNA mismatch endonuclease (patch repair protein)
MRPGISYSRFTSASALSSRTKRLNRQEGGRAERLLRSIVWRRGLRFRKQLASLPGRPDLVFARVHLCVFCDGDFWHGRNWSTLEERLARRANAEYWIPKIKGNVVRDREQTQTLQDAGWFVLRLWETDILRDPEAAADLIEQLVSKRITEATD